MKIRAAALLILFSPMAFGFDLPSGVSEKRMATEVLWKGFEKLPPSERPRVILVLGGGGAKGLSHIGVLRVFREEHIPIDEIVGVSVGALLGSLYAAGISDTELETMANDIGWNNLSTYSKASSVKLFLGDELMSTQKTETYLKARIGDKTFADLAIPFSCVATDLRTGDRVVLKEGSVAFAARASATIPGVFKPVPYRQRLLVDGGLVDNLPTDIVTMRKSADMIVGVLPRANKLPSDNMTIFRALTRAIEIQGRALVAENRKNADVIIEPEVGDVAIADLKRSRECIEAGTIAARRAALDLKVSLLERAIKMSKPPVAER